MKRQILWLVFFIFLGGCISGNKKNESGQLEADKIEVVGPQKQVEVVTPAQSQKRLDEMLALQKQIQDINSEISRLIEYHHNEIDRLKTEKDSLRSKLDALYKIEKELQSPN